jgi:hypothetical protein
MRTTNGPTDDELFDPTLFFTHEIEHGLNPEINSNLYAKLLGGSN